MNQNTKLQRSLLALLLLGACGSGSALDPNAPGLFGTTPGALVSREQAESTAADLLNGQVVASENTVDFGTEVYEVDVLLPSGAIVEVDIEVSTGRVLELECYNPQPGDDIDVGGGLLTLQEAWAIAVGDSEAEVSAWEIERDEDEANDWEWEFVLRTPQGRTVEVEVDAETGAREADDREDDDGWDDDRWDDDRDDDDRKDLPEALERNALGLVPGTIVDVDRDSDDGLDEWEVQVRTVAGGLVELEFLVSSHRLVEAYGVEAPFDLDFQPEGLISLRAALQAAGMQESELEEWELDRDDGRWTYELYSNQDEDAEVDARSGELLED